MEEESLCSSLSDFENSVHQKDSWACIDLQNINGQQETTVWDETDLQTEQYKSTLQEGPEPSEETEEWEQIIWPVRPVSSVTSPLSFATVQWDIPDASQETPSPVTDNSLANELDYCRVTTLDSTSLSLHQSDVINTECFIQEDAEEEDGFESQLLLDSHVKWMRSDFEPCDPVDVQQLMTEEEEDSAQQLSDGNNEILPRTDSDEENGPPATSESVKSVDCSPEESEDGSEDGLVWQNVEDLRREEEQEEPDVLLTAQQTSTHIAEVGDHSEEGDELDREQIVTHVSCKEEAKSISCLSEQEFSSEPLPPASTGVTINPDQLIDFEERQHSETRSRTEDLELTDQLHEDPIGQSEESEMCKDDEQKWIPDQSEAAELPDADEELPVQQEENSAEVPEPTEKLEQAGCLEEDDSHQVVTSQNGKPSPQFDHLRTAELAEASQHFEQEEQLRRSQHLEQPDVTEQDNQPQESLRSEGAVGAQAGDCEAEEQQEHVKQNEQLLQTADLPPVHSAQLVQSEKVDECKTTEQLLPDAEGSHPEGEEESQAGTAAEEVHQAEEVQGSEPGTAQTTASNGQNEEPLMNGGEVDREMACRLAEQLYKLDRIQPVDVVKHLDKDNDFSRAVGEEYLKLFDFTGQTLDEALRSFLKVVVLTGETQERARVLQYFSCRFHQCNPDTFSCSGAVLTLTCALMLLNTDLHGQHVGKVMSCSKFVSNLDGMNEGENFSKELLKSFYNSIKSEPLEWAVDEEELNGFVLLDKDAGEDLLLRSKSNPFQDVPHDKKAALIKQGFLQRKLHADVDGKRTPWGKRSWKTFFGVLRGMVLYLQKDDYRKEHQTSEEVVSVHHSLAEPAADYTKKPHVFRLQTADWRVFLFQASSKAEMNSWIRRINLVSALHSSPPFPAAIGSQRRFCRPILPASQSAHTLEHQMQSHTGMLESFKADLSYLQENRVESRRGRSKELEEQRVRAEYLQHEICRYEMYIQALQAWKNVKKSADSMLSTTELNLFDKAMCADSVEEEEKEEGGLKKSYSSPSLELELPTPTVVKVRRNISERRTYRRTIIPRWNKEIQ